VALTPESLRGPSLSPSQEAALGDVMSVPGSSDIMDLGTGELGLPGYPRVPLRPTSWRQVAGCAELMCSWVATVHRLLKEMLVVVGPDVLQPVWVSPKTERRGFST
jgi:hypothetical protein